MTAQEAWKGTAGSKIFLMQMGFLCYEVGFVNPIWTSSIVIKNLEDTFVGIMTFLMFSYSLSNSEYSLGHFIGGPNHFFLLNTNHDEHASMFIMACYATTCATIVSGAVLERLKNKGYITWTFLMILLNYSFVAHWAWHPKGWLEKLKFHDCAGSLVVHTTGGISGLVAMYYLGPQRGSYDPAAKRLRPVDPSHRPIMVAIGVFILWFGWFSFNITSPAIVGLDIGDKAASIPVATIIAPTASCFTAFFVMRYYFHKVSFEDICGCVLSGLVAETAVCYSTHVWASFLVGCGACGVYFSSSYFIRYKLNIDDPLNIGAIHAFNGLFGIVCDGLFADGTIHGTGLVYGHWKHFCVQILGGIAAVILNLALSIASWHLMVRVLFAKTNLRVTALDTYLGTKLFQLNPQLAFEELLSCKSNVGRQVLLHFQKYLFDRLCDNQLEFLLAITFLRDFEHLPGRDDLVKVVTGINSICDTYITEKGPRAVNVSDYARALPLRMRDAAWSDSHQHLRLTIADRNMFDAAYNEVFKMLLEPLRRFLSTFDRKKNCVSYNVSIPFKLTRDWEMVWKADIERTQTCTDFSIIGMITSQGTNDFQPTKVEMASAEEEIAAARRHAERPTKLSAIPQPLNGNNSSGSDDSTLHLRYKQTKKHPIRVTTDRSVPPLRDPQDIFAITATISTP